MPNGASYGWLIAWMLSTVPVYAGPVEQSQRLEPGWNLTRLSSEDLRVLKGMAQSSDLRVWRATSPAKPDERVPLQPLSSLELEAGPDGGYWIWSARPLEISIAKTPIPSDEALPVVSGEGWYFYAVVRPQLYADSNIDRLLRWDRAAQAYVSVSAGTTLQVGEGYWGYFLAARAPPLTGTCLSVNGCFDDLRDGDLMRPQAPSHLSLSAAKKTIRLWWRAPSLFENGSLLSPLVPVTYRIYRDGQPVETVGELSYQEELPARKQSYHYAVTALVSFGGGQGLESEFSTPVKIQVLEPGPGPVPGAFEVPSPVTDGVLDASFPKTALSRKGEQVHAHVAYVVNNPDGTEEIRMIGSPKAGRANTFGAPLSLRAVPPSVKVAELALAAKNAMVFVAWLERDSAPTAETRSRVYGRESRDGGQTFGDTRTIHESPLWKRNLDVAYDGDGGLHLVYGESHKVYYQKGVDGEPVNVFDERKRMPTTGFVPYMAQYEPDAKEGCACPSCWCEEFYPLSEEPNPKDGGRPLGPYTYRTEQNYMLEPSLHVDDDKVTIIARQTKMWDNHLVPNPAWASMLTNPRYSDKVVERLRPTKLVLGWKAVWKQAYEVGDDLLWDGLGFRVQYLYQGTWHHQDQIKIAQRPLRPGAWSQPVVRTVSGREAHEDAGFRIGAWKNDTEQRFRISLVADGFEGAFENRPSHPKVYTSPDGTMVAAFEKGSSENPNQPDQNPIHLAFSEDGGLSWSPSRVVARGYLPQLAVASGQETAVVFYAPSGEDSGGIQALQYVQGDALRESFLLSTETPAKMHPTNHGTGADGLSRVPSLSAEGALFFAAWVRRAQGPGDRDRIVVSRSSRLEAFSHLDVIAPEGVALQQSAAITVEAQNKYHMRVGHGGEVRMMGASGASADGRAYGPVSGGESLGLSLQDGQVTWVSSVERTVAPPPWAGLATPGLSSVDLALAYESASDQDWVGYETMLVSGNASGNLYRALAFRDGLLKPGLGEGPEPRFYYQVEYTPSVVEQTSQESDNAGLASDSRFLAKFERVWAYTQGIALAQLARGEKEEDLLKARGMARYLCQKAVRDPSGEILGWPFSWNTRDDDWKDARLVTGANAWVVQGLGVFLASKAYRSMPDGDDKKALPGCYMEGLRGLKRHRRPLSVRGTDVVLMTAGWTTEGLQHAGAPWVIQTQKGEALTKDPHETWAYYSVLDAIGYDEFRETDVWTCKSDGVTPCPSLTKNDPSWQKKALDQASHWTALRRRVPAQNTVTEHNLDVLSVLNHALGHRDELSFLSEAKLEELKEWRDRLRGGIFSVLLDTEGWKEEFRQELDEIDASLRSGVARTKSQQAHLEHRKDRMALALEHKDLSRIITGGELISDSENRYTLRPSLHSAIDNCSWLSLSVDYASLPTMPAEDPSTATARLGQCLEYTILQYVKDLRFGPKLCDAKTNSCPPEKTYRGTHYFQNAFRDPYIAPSELQESSYHLEATMGLIAGLLRFSEAHPEHPRSPVFAVEARALWAGAQAFVRDYGFAYSSQRIQDLSTQLSSSTAALWFIDVHEAFALADRDLDRPLRPYFEGFEGTGVSDRKRAAVEALFVKRADGDAEADAALLVQPGEEQKPHVLIKDQALALLAAVVYEKPALASAWAKGLLSTAVKYTEGEDSRLEFPYRAWGSNGQPVDAVRDVETSMWALYALASYVDASLSTPLKEEIVSVVSLGFETLFAHHVEGNEGQLAGLARSSETDPHGLATWIASRGIPEQAFASLSDNIMFYFALERWARMADGFAEREARTRLGVLQERLFSLCGLRDNRPPARLAIEGEPYWASTHADDYGRCALFFAHRGRIDAALHIIDAAVQVQDASPQLERSFPWVLFGRRAIAAVDPRQDEMAFLKMATDSGADDSLADHAAFLLLNRPRGVLGAFAPRLVPEAPREALALEPEPSSLGLVEKRLASRALDLVSTLLASEFKPYRFDAIVSEILRVRWAHDRLLQHAAMSFDDSARLVGYELSDGLCEPGAWLRRAFVSLEDYFGMDCRLVRQSIARLFESRGGLEGSAWVAAFEFGPARTRSEFGQDVLFESLGRGFDASPARLRLGSDSVYGFGSGPTSFDAYRGRPSVAVPAQASLGEVREAIRRRKQTAIEDALRDAGADALSSDDHAPSKIFYELAGLDVIEAFNPASPVYWSREAVEFRIARSGVFEGGVQYMLHNRPQAAPAFPLESEHAVNVSFLRRRINVLADGRLFVFGKMAGVSNEAQARWQTSVHRSLRTGVISSPGLQTLFDGLALDDEERVFWQKSLHLQPDPLIQLLPSSTDVLTVSVAAPSLDNVLLAISRLTEELALSGAGEEREGTVEFGRLLLLARGKLVSKFGQSLEKSLDDMSGFSPLLSIPLLAGVEAVAFLGGAEVDASLETILAGPRLPSPEFWEEVGVVEAKHVVSQPTAAYFRPEDDIRREVSIYPKDPHIENPLTQAPVSFEEDGLYFIKMDWWGMESPLGNIGVLNPQKDALWPVFRLRSTRPASEIIQDFVHSHKLWQLLAPRADGFSDGMREGWLHLLELAIRGAFNVPGAEKFGAGRGGFPRFGVGPKADGPGIYGGRRQEPFFSASDGSSTGDDTSQNPGAPGDTPSELNWTAFKHSRVARGLDEPFPFVPVSENVDFDRLEMPEAVDYEAFTRIQWPMMPLHGPDQTTFFAQVAKVAKEKLERGRSIKSSAGRILDGWKIEDPKNRIVTAFEWMTEFQSGSTVSYLWTLDPTVIPGEDWWEVVQNHDGLNINNLDVWQKGASKQERQRVSNAIYEWLRHEHKEKRKETLASTGAAGAESLSLSLPSSVHPRVEHSLDSADIDWINPGTMPLDPAQTSSFLQGAKALEKRLAEGLKARGFEPGETRHRVVEEIVHPKTMKSILLNYRFQMDVGDADYVTILWKVETKPSSEVLKYKDGGWVLLGNTDAELVENFSQLPTAMKNAWDATASKEGKDALLLAGERTATAGLKEDNIRFGRTQGYSVVAGRLITNESDRKTPIHWPAMPANDLTAQRLFFESDFPRWIRNQLDQDGSLPKTADGRYRFTVKNVAPYHVAYPPYVFSLSKEVSIDVGQGKKIEIAYWQPGVIPGHGTEAVLKNYRSLSKEQQDLWRSLASSYDQDWVRSHHETEIDLKLREEHPASIPPTIKENSTGLDAEAIMASLPDMPIGLQAFPTFRKRVQDVLGAPHFQSLTVDVPNLEGTLDALNLEGTLDQYMTQSISLGVDSEFKVVTAQEARLVYQGQDAAGVPLKKVLIFSWAEDAPQELGDRIKETPTQGFQPENKQEIDPEPNTDPTGNMFLAGGRIDTGPLKERLQDAEKVLDMIFTPLGIAIQAAEPHLPERHQVQPSIQKRFLEQTQSLRNDIAEALRLLEARVDLNSEGLKKATETASLVESELDKLYGSARHFHLSILEGFVPEPYPEGLVSVVETLQYLRYLRTSEASLQYLKERNVSVLEQALLDSAELESMVASDQGFLHDVGKMPAAWTNTERLLRRVGVASSVWKNTKRIFPGGKDDLSIDSFSSVLGPVRALTTNILFDYVIFLEDGPLIEETLEWLLDIAEVPPPYQDEQIAKPGLSPTERLELNKEAQTRIRHIQNVREGLEQSWAKALSTDEVVNLWASAENLLASWDPSSPLPPGLVLILRQLVEWKNHKKSYDQEIRDYNTAVTKLKPILNLLQDPLYTPPPYFDLGLESDDVILIRLLRAKARGLEIDESLLKEEYQRWLNMGTIMPLSED